MLPGVMSNLEKLAKLKGSVLCGLVTGNVEGIARRKMKSVGIYDTGALCAPSISQIESKEWPGAENIGFLGEFILLSGLYPKSTAECARVRSSGLIGRSYCAPTQLLLLRRRIRIRLLQWRCR